MINLDDKWTLHQGNTLLGTLTFKNLDMFWVFCDFVSTQSFEPYRALFEDEYRILDDAQWDEAYSKIRNLDLSLHIAGKFDEQNFILLHIIGDEAWFRALIDPSTGGWVGFRE